MKETISKIYDYALEEIMGDRFGRYAREIIQNRAIPDARDGLKPVQRRILYGMYHDHNTCDKAYRKSAKTVGYIMGNYHPHGDSSIYDAMVRMSQWWKQNTPYVDMHGNNGSMDGDSAAAMRYTEARLSKISNELLKDIYKDTVLWAPNFDDTEMEPTVLPAKFPNLLVNGSTGISAGYATNIPPHNLGEIIDATIKRIDSPNCRLETLMDIVKGPDFPTGGTACGKKEMIKAFETGRGKVIVKSKIEIIEKGKPQIIITEIPFEVNKALMVKKIDEIRIDKKIDGIAEVRDETDREGLRIAIDLKKGANTELILNYLLKNTDLQVAYNYNMVAIVNKVPKTLGLIEILDAYISHQKEVITKRTQFDLNHAEARMHIVEGLIKALSILDEVIRVIRSSKNKSNAIDNLQKEFNFSKLQAEAIVNLQLYKLTNTDVTELEAEMEKLMNEIKIWKQILENEEALKHIMKTELKNVKKEYATDRKTVIKDEVKEIKIDETALIPKEDCMVVVTNDGYVKRVSKRSYSSSEDETGLKEKDFLISLYETNTMDTLILFTDLGNFLYVPVYELPDLKWKDLGKHISNIIKINSDEKIMSSYLTNDFTKNVNFLSFSKNGMVKQTKLEDLKIQRYTKPITLMKLKSDDKIVNTVISKKEIFITTQNGFGLRYLTEEVPLTGLRGSGVKSIKLVEDEVISGSSFDNALYDVIFTDKNTAKRIKIDEFELSSRGRKGLLSVRNVKTNPYKIIKSFIVSKKEEIGIITDEINYLKLSDISIGDRNQTGNNITKEIVNNIFIKTTLEEKEEIETEELDLNNVDEKMMTIDDYLKDFDIK